VFDQYSRRARLAPAFLAMLPALGLCGAAAFSAEDVLKIAGLAFGALGLAACGLVRDRGRKIEPALWTSWRGSPTTRQLRWREAEDVPATARLHKRIEDVLGHQLPSEAEEQHDPADADRRYDEAVTALRERTRDKERFRLVFEENMEYGFRRNSLGLRPVGLAVAAAALIAACALLIADSGAVGPRLSRWGVSALFSLAVLIFWLMFVNPEWVRRAAELYATRLLEAVHSLP
jgi:hypothetical protein